MLLLESQDFGRDHHVPFLQVNIQFLQQRRWTMWTSASFMFQMCSLLQVFATITGSIWYFKLGYVPQDYGHFKQDIYAGNRKIPNVMHQRDRQRKLETHKTDVALSLFKVISCNTRCLIWNRTVPRV